MSNTPTSTTMYSESPKSVSTTASQETRPPIKAKRNSQKARVFTSFTEVMNSSLETNSELTNDLKRNKLNEVEAFKFIMFIALNIELVDSYAFSKSSKSAKKGSVLKGFYKKIQSLLAKSRPDLVRERTCSVLRGHLHRLLPSLATYVEYKKDTQKFSQIHLSVDKISKTMLAQMVLLLFAPDNRKRLVSLRN